MQIRIFSIPITDNGEMQAEMNRFLAASRVLEIEQRFYQNEKGAYWSFCVRYLNGGKIKMFRKFRRILIGTNHV